VTGLSEKNPRFFRGRTTVVDLQEGKTMFELMGKLSARLTLLVAEDDGMSTAEYAIGTIAAAAFGAVLYSVVTGDSIVSALTGIIDKALKTAV
jgi:hypothetical protein